jgi:polyhydroxybutyrate depolymerase
MTAHARVCRNVAFVAAVVSVGVATASAQRPENMTWKVEGVTRRAIMYTPPPEALVGRYPVIFAFHGHGDNIQNFQYTGLHTAWQEAIVVYFQGLPSRRDGEPGWQVEKGEDEDRDLKLVDAALASISKFFVVDTSRIYATGFSNGANFTYLLWAERPNVFAAYAPVAARLRPSVQPTQPRPLFHVAGRRDSRIPFVDQEAAMATARRVDGVTGDGVSCGTGCTIYGESRGTSVMTWIHPGGHEYPPSTSDRIVKFFRDHPLKR